eukprot:CAMPEP_0196753804 /NCGR_PEP_ID=MMETSP1091-20130531/91834_1 /TAXON_ID=302021 /ORGANISM="Rhodomonas sp., Strain CCMP768" /LENGTH=48 /DNA_ID= /DNA_START= /DNA_END= /DNA_ORIENTATION=
MSSPPFITPSNPISIFISCFDLAMSSRRYSASAFGSFASSASVYSSPL